MLAALSAALKVVIVPIVLRRLLRGGPAHQRLTARSRAGDIAGSGALGLASTVLLAIAVAAFGFFAVGALRIRSPVLPADRAVRLGVGGAGGLRADDPAP